MPFDEGLATRLQETVSDYSGMTENRMMGGFGYLLNGNMCVGIHHDCLIVRVGIQAAQEILQEAHVRPMDFTGRIMKGWATIEPEAIGEDLQLQRFCQLAIAFVETLPAK